MSNPYQILVYPTELSEMAPDGASGDSPVSFLHFTCLNLFETGDGNDVNVILPIPEGGIENANGGTWQFPDNALKQTKSAYDTIVNSAKKDKTVGDWMGNSADSALALVAAAAGTDNELLGLLSGVSRTAVSPGRISLFQQSKERTFTMKWKFMPRSEEESDMVKLICDTFTAGSLPYRDSPSGLKLKYPPLWKVEFRPNTYMFEIRDCVLSDVVVSHGDGKFSEFSKTHAPTQVGLTLTFHETILPVASADDTGTVNTTNLIERLKGHG